METTKKGMKPILIFGGVLLAIALVLFLSINVIPKALVSLTRASSSGTVSVSNSYLLGQKILAKADGKDKCLVVVFLLDKNGRGVAGKSVELEGMDNITKLNSVSDEKGQVTFDMTSTIEGQFKLRANYSGVDLPQTVTVTFRN